MTTHVQVQLSAAEFATLRDIRDDLQREGERIGMPFVRRGLVVLDKLLEADVLADTPRALCHECSEMVEVVAGKLSPHHGESGDGCPLNSSDAQIYLHPLVADRIAWLETALVFGAPGGAR